MCGSQAVHSGADLQSAAASVLGYDQVSMKGKTIKVAPVPEVATAELKSLLEAVLPKADEEAEARLQGKAGTAGIMHTLTEVGNLLAVRRLLLPFLTRGNQGCGGRLRYGINAALTSPHMIACGILVLCMSTVQACWSQALPETILVAATHNRGVGRMTHCLLWSTPTGFIWTRPLCDTLMQIFLPWLAHEITALATG